MKPQFFPDEHDYVKLSILRHLLQEGLTCTVCWMMTQSNGKGRRGEKEYLNFPDLFEDYDPAVFKYLKQQDKSGAPDIRSIESTSLFENCSFYWEDFPEPPKAAMKKKHLIEREKYFAGCLDEANTGPRVF